MQGVSRPFFTIIVGAYNVARFLPSGIEALLRQTYSDFEVILVDDGSSDGLTPQLCDEIAARDNRVKVVHKPNGGLGSARNVGLEVASGQYIGFYDVDDCIEPICLEKVYHYLITEKSELLIFGYKEINLQYQTKTDVSFSPCTCQSNKEVRTIYVDKLLGIAFNNGFVWNKIYRADLLQKNHIHFGNQRIQQDEIFNQTVYAVVQTIKIVPDIFYIYHVYNSGNNRSHYIPNRLDIYTDIKNSFLRLYDFWKLHDERMLKYVYLRYFQNIIQTLRDECCHIESVLTPKERRIEIDKILHNKEVEDCLVHLTSLQAMPSVWRLKVYYWSIERKSVRWTWLIISAERIFDTIKKGIKHVIKNT